MLGRAASGRSGVVHAPPRSHDHRPRRIGPQCRPRQRRPLAASRRCRSRAGCGGGAAPECRARRRSRLRVRPHRPSCHRLRGHARRHAALRACARGRRRTRAPLPATACARGAGQAARRGRRRAHDRGRHAAGRIARPARRYDPAARVRAWPRPRGARPRRPPARAHARDRDRAREWRLDRDLCARCRACADAAAGRQCLRASSAGALAAALHDDALFPDGHAAAAARGRRHDPARAAGRMGYRHRDDVVPLGRGGTPGARRHRRARGVGCAHASRVGAAQGARAVSAARPRRIRARVVRPHRGHADRIPRIQRLGPGGYSIFGYNGRGIAPGTLFGRAFAQFASTQDEGAFPLPPVDAVHAPFASGALEMAYDAGAVAAHLVDART